MTKKARRLTALGIGLLLCVLADQFLLHVLIDDGRLWGSRIAPYDPPIFSPAQEQLLEQLEGFVDAGNAEDASRYFDAQLGWCPPASAEYGGKNFDSHGARIGPSEVAKERTPGLGRIVAVGCSFTLGHEVEDGEAWPFVLDLAHDSLEVVNLGVNAYGLDQSWLRYQRDGADYQGDEVWLGWLPTASRRLGSVYRPALSHWSGPLMFKPRFRFVDGELALEPNPTRNQAQLFDALTNQEAFLAAAEHDFSVQRAPESYAALGSSWMHGSGLGRMWLTYAERGGREPATLLEEPTSEFFQLAVEIVRAFRAEVEASGANFKLLVLPGRDVLAYRQEHGRGYWEGVVAELEDSGIEVVDLTSTCMDAGMLEDDTAWQSGSHYSAKGNQIIADALGLQLGGIINVESADGTLEKDD